MSEFKTILIEKRKQLGLSQREMADYLHVTRQAISKWENGKGMPDMAFLPEISELLGVTVDELLTGKTPEKQIVEKVIVQEKEVVKPIPASKILAIVLPILVVIIVASVLLGVYIPKALAPEPSPFLPEEPEITYTEVFIKGKSDTDDSNFQAPLINNKAYYGLGLDLSGEYTFYITAPKGATATLIEMESISDDAKIKSNEIIAEFNTAKTVEFTRYFKSAYYGTTEGGWKYKLSGKQSNVTLHVETGKITYSYCFKIVIDLTNCSEEDRQKEQQKLVVRQHMGFEDVIVPANSTYFVALPVNKDLSAEHYIIKSEGIGYVDTRYLAPCSQPISMKSIYETCRSNYQYTNNSMPISEFYVLNFGNGIEEGKEGDWYIGLINETDNDISLRVETAPIEEISLGEVVSFKVNGIPENKTVYKLNVDHKMRFMFLFRGQDYHTGSRFGFYSESTWEGNLRLCYHNETDWYYAGSFCEYYVEPGEYYVVARTYKDMSDFDFIIMDYDEYKKQF